MRPSTGNVILTIWIVLTCLVAGVVAAVAGMPSVWGSGAVFIEYAVPLPLGWGLAHWPGLLAFGLLLRAALGEPDRWLIILRDLSVGTLAGVLVAYLLVAPVRGFPLLMYVAVDALLALAFSTFVNLSAQARAPTRRIRTGALSGPALLVLAAVVIWPLAGERYRVSMTDTITRGRVETLRVFAVLRRGGRDKAAECASLKALADKYRNRFTQRATGLPMDGTVLLFEDSDDVGRENASSAWVRYTWRTGQSDYCDGQY